MAGMRKPTRPRHQLGMPQRMTPMQRPKGGMQGGNTLPGRPQAGMQGGMQPGWAQRGYDSKEAQQSVTRQYGLVKDEMGNWVKPGLDFLTRQMEHQGWGPQFQKNSLNEAGTPINIGGMRWMSGKNGVNFTGEQADTGIMPMGQSPYGGGRKKRRTMIGGDIY